MKIGILIIFRNDESAISVENFSKLFAIPTKLNICFVNNGSTDHTLELLKEIQEEANVPISIIDVKKNRGHDAAIKAGARYLNSTHDLPYILCLKSYTSKDFLTLKNVFQHVQRKNGIVKELFFKTKYRIQKNVFSLRGILETVC